MKKIVAVVAFCFAGSALAADKAAPAAVVATPAAVVPATPPVAAPVKVKGEGNYFVAEELKWESPMGPQGPTLAFIVGDMKTKNKPATFYMKFPAGFESPWHIHDGEYTATVIKGTVTHQVQGGAEHTLTTGSTWTQGAKGNHLNKCLATGGECWVLATNAKGFSFTPKMADGKDVPAPPKDAKATGGSH